MQHHAAITMRFAASTRKLAPIYAQNNTRTPDDKSHAAIPMRSASTEIPKHPITTHAQAHPKQLQATVTLRQKKNDKPTPAAPVAHTRYLSSSPAASCSHFTRKNTGFRALASSPKHSPCNIMQPLQCGSQHQLANLHLSTHRTTPEHQMTRVMQPFQCDLQARRFQNILKLRTHKHTQSSLKPPLHCGKN